MKIRALLAILLLGIVITAQCTTLSEHLDSYEQVFASRIPPRVEHAHRKLLDNEEWLISAFGHKFHLELKRNKELIPATYKTFSFDDEGSVVESPENTKRDKRNHCHYVGSARVLSNSTRSENTKSFVAVSLCGGALHGEIQVDSHHFFVEPSFLHFSKEEVEQTRKDCLLGGKWRPNSLGKVADCVDHHLHLSQVFRDASFDWAEKSVPHIVYRHDQIKEEHKEYSCGVDGKNGLETHDLHDHEEVDHLVEHFHGLGVNNIMHMDTQYIEDVKYVELLVVNDRSRYVARSSNQANVEANSETLVNIAAARYRAANLFPQIIIVLTAQITITSANSPWSVDSCQGNSAETDHAVLLDNFLSWVWGNAPRSLIAANVNYDNAQLFTNQDFCGGTVGFAPVGAMCYGGKSGGINQMTFADQQSANILTHEMGHNFNMLHDGTSSGNSCPNAGYVMASSGCLTCSSFVTEFSTCSKGYYSSMMQYRPTSTACLDNKPVYVYGNPSCGDGFVEGDEECDCGSSDCSSKDPCCNGATCKLQPGADCSNSQACCQNCRIVARSANKECRRSFNSACDEAEICDGIYADCPANVYKAPGTSCTDDDGNTNGRCYQGGCLTHDVQCRGIYEVNTGACGIIGDTSCDNPLTCWVFDDVSGQAQCTSFQVIIGEGTPCGPGKQCHKGSCVTSVSLYHSWSLYCDVSCSGAISREYRCKRYDGTFVIDSLCSGTRPNATSAESCGSFAPQICSVNVTSSTGGAVTLGDNITITWSTLRQVDFVSILLYTTGITTPQYIRVSQADVGSYVWPIPRGIPAGTHRVEVVVSHGVSKRTVETITTLDQCIGVSCQNGGACQNGLCTCIDGYRGASCSSSRCASSDLSMDCMNGASCHPTTKSCVCDIGYSGKYCQVDEGSCSLSCGNNGQVNTNCTSCVCDGFYAGSDCGTCTLSCGSKGTLEGGCMSCKCNDFVWGDRCDANYANITINFKNLDTNLLKNTLVERVRFKESLEQEVALVLGVDSSRILVDESTINANATGSSSTTSVRFILRGSDLEVSTLETLIVKLVDAIKNPYSDSYRLAILQNTDADAGLIIVGDGLFKNNGDKPWYLRLLDWVKANLKIVIPVVIAVVLLVLYKVHSDSQTSKRQRMAGVHDADAVQIQVHHKVRPKNAEGRRHRDEDDEGEGERPKAKAKAKKPAEKKKKRKAEKKVRGEDELADEFGVRVVSGGSKAPKGAKKAAADVDDLPPNWSVQYFDDGTPFYFNSVTNDISQTKPQWKP
jgi:hypothetical protein